jgi:hypothetical protein
MAGETSEMDLEDAMGIASFYVATGHVPPASLWVESLVQSQRRDCMEAFF